MRLVAGRKCELERVVTQQVDRKLLGRGRQQDEARHPLREIARCRALQRADRLRHVNVRGLGIGRDLPLERFSACAQLVAELGDRCGVAPAFGELRLELRRLDDLPTADVADQQGDAGPAQRLGRDPADIGVHVLGHQCRRQAVPILRGRGNDCRREADREAVLETEHDHREPQRVGVGAGDRRREHLLGEDGDTEQEHKLEDETERRRPARAARGGARGQVRIAAHVVHRRLLRTGSSRVSAVVRELVAPALFAPSLSDWAVGDGTAMVQLSSGALSSSAGPGASLRCTSQISRRAAFSSTASIMRTSRAEGISDPTARWMLTLRQ